MLVALLTNLAPAIDMPLAGEVGAQVSAPADMRGEAAALIITANAIEDLDEEADQEEAVFLARAPLHCPPGGAYGAADGWLPAVPRPSSHPCTGPPTL